MTSKRNPFLTAREVRNQAKILSDVRLTTIKRYLRESNLHGRVAAKKPLLNKVQTKKEKSGVKRTQFSVPQIGAR